MSDDKLDFLNANPEEADATPVAEVEIVQEAEAEAPQVEAEPEGTGEPKAAPPVAAEEKPTTIPVTALLDEREKRQKAERELEEMRRWRQQIEAQQKQGQKKPDFFDNPDQAVQQALLANKVQQSRFLAEREFGAEAVNEAMAYYDLHPQETQRFLSHPSPFHAAMEHYKRQKFLEEVQDPDKWREAERELIRQELMAQAPTAQPSKPTAPPPSMARAPSAGRVQPSQGTAFDELFPV